MRGVKRNKKNNIKKLYHNYSNNAVIYVVSWDEVPLIGKLY